MKSVTRNARRSVPWENNDFADNESVWDSVIILMIYLLRQHLTSHLDRTLWPALYALVTQSAEPS